MGQPANRVLTGPGRGVSRGFGRQPVIPRVHGILYDRALSWAATAPRLMAGTRRFFASVLFGGLNPRAQIGICPLDGFLKAGQYAGGLFYMTN